MNHKGQSIKRILLLWYMEDENFGDVLIYKTVSTFLREHGFEVESQEVGESCLKIFERASEFDFLLFAGGGIIERYIPEVIRHFKKNFDQLKVPYGVMGFGMGDFDYSNYTHTLALWVKEATFFYVRDEQTQIWLNQNCGMEKAIYSADCVFGNKTLREMAQQYQNCRSDMVQQEVRQGHGINLRDLPYKDLTGDYDWNIMNEIVNQIQGNLIIPDSSDEVVRLKRHFDNQQVMSDMKLLSTDEKIKMILNEIQKCEWIVAMRFHVVLVAAMFGIVTVPIKYCPKVKYLSEQLGLMDLAVDIDEYGEIPDRVQNLVDNKAFYESRIQANILKMEKRADAMFEDVLNVLKEG